MGLVALALFVLALALVGSAVADEHESHESKVVLRFDSMLGVPGNGNLNNLIRGFQGAPRHWTILRSVQGELRTDGSLTIFVRGFVIPSLDNTNPLHASRAALTCQDPNNSDGSLFFFTGPFPAITENGPSAGDSNIVGKVQRPAQCFAPLIFIDNAPASGNGVFLAVTGFQPASE